jgi:hypothetical protein
MTQLMSDSTLRAMLRAVGAEEWQTDRGPLLCIFERTYQGIGDIPVESGSPQLMAVSADVVTCGLSVGCLVIRESETYVVRSVQPDGTGMTVLLLEGP